MEDQMTGYIVMAEHDDAGWEIPVFFVDSAEGLLGFSTHLSQMYGIELGDNPIVQRVRITILE